MTAVDLRARRTALLIDLDAAESWALSHEIFQRITDIDNRIAEKVSEEQEYRWRKGT